MKKGLLLYADEDYKANEEFAQRFVKNCKDYRLNIKIALESNIRYGVKEGFYFEAGKIKPDFVINRTRNYYLAKVLEQLDVRVFNNSGVTRLCNDKAAAYLYAAEQKVPCLDTLIYAKEYVSIEEFPVIIKQPFSHGGKKVFLCGNKEELLKNADKTEGGYAVVQNMLKGGRVNDIRVFVLNNSIIGAVKRTAAKGNFKANYSQGGEISLFSLPEKVVGYIERFTKNRFYDFAGFDFLTADFENYYFNEIEDCVGSRTLCILADIDTSALYMRHISKNMHCNNA